MNQALRVERERGGEKEKEFKVANTNELISFMVNLKIASNTRARMVFRTFVLRIPK